MIKKIIIGLVAFFVLLIGALVAIPFFFKDEINQLVKEQINGAVNASVDYSNYDLSLISTFPDFEFALNDLVVVGQDNFANDTLAMINQLAFRLNAKKLIVDKSMHVKSVFVDKLNLKAYVLEDSTKNFDIVKPAPTAKNTTENENTKKQLVNVSIESFQVKNSNILYVDKLTAQTILLKNININGSANYVEENIAINTKANLDEILYQTATQKLNLENFALNTDANYSKDKKLKAQSNISATQANFISEKNTLLNKIKLNIDGLLNADLAKNTYNLDKVLGLNALKIDLKGDVALQEKGTAIDLVFASNQSTFKELLSIIPPKYIKDYEKTEVKGNFALKGNAKGLVAEKSVPAFAVDLNIANGYIKNPDLPTPIENINLNASAKNTNANMSQMVVDIPKAHFEIAKEKIDASLKMTDAVNNAFIDLKAKGKFDLAKVSDFYTIENLKTLDGNMAMDFAFKGKLKDVENKQFDAVDFTGFFDLKNMNYASKDVPLPVNVKTMHLDFSPKYAQMSNLDMRYGNSDIKANGKLENIINYVFNKGVLKGDLALQSQQLNLTEIIGEDEKENSSKTESTTTTPNKSKATRVPKNIDFTATAQIQNAEYDKIKMNNVNGKLHIKDQAVNINQVQANLLGGNAKINGKYSTKAEGKPKIDFNYKVKDFDIQQTFKAVNTVEKIAPIAQFLNGKFSSSFDLNSYLNDDFSPDLTMLNGLGDVKVSVAKLMNFPLFNSVSNAVNLPVLNQLNNATLKNMWTVFKVKDGKVNVEPFDYNYQDVKMHLYGSNGFDKTIDYVMQITVPSNKFGGAANVANQWLSQQNIPLLNAAVPSEITFHLNVKGLINSPKVKIAKVTTGKSNKGVAEQIKENVVDKAKEEAEKLRKQAEQKAREEAEKLRQQAEQKAREEAERLRKEAEDKIKNEADKILDNLPNFGF